MRAATDPNAKLRGRLESFVIESAALRGNVLGDPDAREVLVYLPPSYDASSTRRYPVVVILAPYAATNRSMVAWRLWEPSTFELYESLLARGEAEEAILVSPDCCNRWGGSQFLDSPASGLYQSHVAGEVLPAVDARYRTIAEKAGRAVVGRSSGGFGALRIALDRPELFAAVGSHAGDGLFEVSIRPTFTSVAITIDREGGLEKFLERFERTGPKGGGDFDTIAMIATAAAYAPAPDAPFPHCELPFDPRTALPIDAVWQRFLEHDPVVRLERDASAMRDLALVFLDAGDRDEHGLQFAARRMAELLRARGANVRHEEFPGGHRGTHARYAVSLPALIGALAR
ncbi:alpha/beta hydrolase [Sandaracinus amylolyticus]|uniref:alpha/beta hydrolase n=1 Tax=Sandaracinus amylolyticus TaxID=927083 RepID=UPI001F44AD87|nr:alpha/beta hydrolase-fold protein [Sandaracinus amylolyticus]UJR82075.1 Enterochelin esterase [Sandaracinus amylolyticus]